MKKLILILTSLFSLSTVAAPAMSFKCGGVETMGDKTYAIDFEVNYSDWVAGSGYTSETINITDPAKKMPMRTTDLTVLRNLSNSFDCVELTELELQTTPTGFQYYKFELKNSCGENNMDKFNVLGFCEKTI